MNQVHPRPSQSLLDWQGLKGEKAWDCLDERPHGSPRMLHAQIRESYSLDKYKANWGPRSRLDTELTLTAHLRGKPDMTTGNWTTARSRNNNETGQDFNPTVPTYSIQLRLHRFFNLEHVAGLEQKTKNQNQKEWVVKLSVLVPYQVLLCRQGLFLVKKEKEKSPLSFAFTYHAKKGPGRPG